MITASLVTYNTPDEEITHSLELLSNSCVTKVWVIDNSSSPAIRDICSRYSIATYIPSTNIGYGAAHNIAISHALSSGACYHAVLNTDLDYHPSTFRSIVQYLDSHPDVGMVQPRLVTPDGQMIHSCRLLPTPFDLIIRRFLPKCCFKQRRNRYLLTDLDPDTEHNIPYHQGSFMTLRLKAIEQEGVFDTKFFMYSEDIDLTRRIHRHWRTMYIPYPTVIHTHRKQSYHSPVMAAIHAVNIIRYFNKWGWFYDPEATEFNSRLLK